MTIERANPYPGPEFFVRGDARPYFGRDQETADLSSMAVTERLLLFYAPSGAGKTSLLNKRLIPRLEEKLYEVLPAARVSGAASLPAKVRNVYTYNLMMRLVPDDPQPERFAELSLSEFLWHVSTKDGKAYFYDPGDQALRKATPVRDLWPRVLILDQFEEIVTTYPAKWEHRDDFFRQLDEALRADPMLRVVMSLRSDYVQDLERYAGLLQHGLRARYQMLLMGTKDALSAIEGPAAECGRSFVPGVARRLVENMSQVRDLDAEGRAITVPGETVEPIQLQVVCYQLWESMKQAPGDRIEMADLWRLARESQAQRSSEARSGQEDENYLLSVFIDGALGAFYERALKEAMASAGAHVDEAFLRNWFSDKLITESGARGFLQRGEDETGGVSEEVVQKLIDNHLLRSDTRGSIRLVELIHDRFVDPIIDANLLWNQQRRRAQPWIDAAYSWYESGDSPQTRTGALLEGASLKAVLAQTGGHHFEPAVEDYLAASKAGQEKRDQETALNAERIKAEEANRTAGQLRGQRVALAVLAGGIAFLLLIVGVLAINLRDQRDTVAAKNIQLDDQNKQLGTQNITLEVSRTELSKLNVSLRQETNRANAARDENRSLTLADRSTNAAQPEDRLLLARASMAVSNTLAANRALLDALDEGYRDGTGDGTGEFAPFVPHDLLDLEGATNLRSLAFSQDGALLALGDKAGGIWLWDNAAGTLIGDGAVANGTKGEPSLVFDPVRSRLASASGDQDNPTNRAHNLVLWDLEDPNVPQATVLASNQPSIWSLAFSPDGNLLAAGQQDGTVALWDLSGSAPISHTLPGRHADWVYAVAFSPQGQRLASAGKDGLILLWDDIGSAAPVSRTLEGHEAWVNDVVFSPDGTTLASGSDDGTVRLWDLTADPPTSRVLDDHSDDYSEAWELAFSPDGRQLAVGWKDSVLRIYRSDAWDQPPLELHGHIAGVWDLAFDPMTPGHLVSFDENGDVLFRWDLAKQSEFVASQPLFQPDDLTLQAVSPDDRWLAAADANSHIFLGEIGANRWPVSFTVGMSVTALAVAPSDDLLAVAGCTLREDAPGIQAVPTSQAKPGTAPTVEASQSPTSTVSSAISRPRLTDCNMQVWQVSGGERLTHTEIISYSQPVRALAFMPNETGKIAVGLESGKIEIRNLVSGSVVQLEGDEVRELTDLAFNASSKYLAALGSQGLVRVWNLENGKVEHESEPGDNEEYDKETHFDEIAFVGDEWLSISISAPDEIGVWTLKTAEPVATFNLTSTAILDLAYDSHQQMLVALEPDRILRWTMSPRQWLELACARAGRNLSFDEWQRAFPDQPDEYGSAQICEYPLDISFAEAKIDEAETFINDCTAEQWDEGMKLLEEAAGLKVEPQLDLDTIARAVANLGDQALEHYAKNSPVYDEDARKCLELAAEKLIEAGREGFSLETAEEVGQRQAKLTAGLDDPNSANMVAMFSDLDWLRQNRAQWPGELPSVVLDPGVEIIDQLKRNQYPSFYFLGEQGKAVTISMDATGGGLDTYLYLNGPDGYSLTSDDDSGGGYNSLISDFVLPESGLYRIRPEALSGEGGYRLALEVRDLPELEFGQTATSESAADGSWLFDGKAGQIVTLDMEINGDGSDSYLALKRAGESIAENYGDGRIDPEVLTADDLYVVTANLGYGSGTFSITLNLLEPLTLTVDQPEVSTTEANEMWAFEGTAGQIVNITLTSADPDRFDPEVDLHDALGGVSSDNSGDRTTARIRNYFLPKTGTYYVRTGPGRNSTPYTLTVSLNSPPALPWGVTEEATSDDVVLWALDGRAGQIISASVTTSDEFAQPTLLWLSSRGATVASVQADEETGFARIPGYVLRSDGFYYLWVDGLEGQTPYQLRVEQIEPAKLAAGQSVASSTDGVTFWTLAAEPGQVVQISLNAAEGSGLDPLVRLFGADGQQIDSNDDGGVGYNSLLTTVLSDSPSYLVQADDLGGSGAFTLSVDVLEPDLLPLDGSSVPILHGQVSKVAGEAGQVLTVDILPGSDFDYSSIKLMTANGQLVGASEGDVRLVAVLPQNGDYLIIPSYVSDYGGDSMTATLSDASNVPDLDDAASQTMRALALNNAIDLALDLYAWGTTVQNVRFTADARNALCRFGALRGAAGRVIDICEELLGNSGTTDTYTLAQYHDSRGLARALTNNAEGAAVDFEFYAANGGYYPEQRRDWAQRLRDGDPATEVLDEATLQEVLSQ